MRSPALICGPSQTGWGEGWSWEGEDPVSPLCHTRIRQSVPRAAWSERGDHITVIGSATHPRDSVHSS